MTVSYAVYLVADDASGARAGEAQLGYSGFTETGYRSDKSRLYGESPADLEGTGNG